MLTPYIAEGLAKGELCFGIQKAHVIWRLHAELRAAGIDVEGARERGALVLRPGREAYFTEGRFEPARMKEALIDLIDDAARRGFAGLRTAGDLSWVANDPSVWERILDYEAWVQCCYPGRTATGFCQYPVGEFPANVVHRLTASHGAHLTETAPIGTHHSLHIRSAVHNTEIVASKEEPVRKYYYVVQQNLSREALAWGVERDFESAAARATQADIN